MPHSLLLRGPYREETIASLRDALSADWTLRIWNPDEGAPAYAEALAEADATVAMSWSAETPPAPNLKLLQLPGAGWDRLQFEQVPTQAAVCNVFEHEIGIAEYVLATMLMWEIRPDRMDAGLRNDDWSTSGWSGAGLHGELYGKTLGIVGYGRIGRESARRARAFGMPVRACSRTPRPDDLVERCEGMDKLDELLGASDYVLVSMPLTASNPNLFDADRLAAMRPAGVIINVSRGGLIDEQALYDALKNRRIGGAVIDTWYNYPKGGKPTAPSRLPFRDLDNIIMTPHASAWSAGLLARRWRWIGENMNRLARGEPLDNVIRTPGGPPPN
ncbi:MAG: 2-hydroxyacid dehydrogenase [Alphaproteobacteria bacterium]